MRRVFPQQYRIEGRINSRKLTIEMTDVTLRDIRILHPYKIAGIIQKQSGPTVTVIHDECHGSINWLSHNIRINGDR